MTGGSISNASAGVLALATSVQRDLGAAPAGQRAKEIAERLNGPLRIAIAGRVKTGKSTLLNALVGERLAPTDASECTRLVSWYQRGEGYGVSAHLQAGEPRTLAFQRGDGSLDIELGTLAEQDVRYLEVRWPASTLARVTLIDTPGLASLNDENSRRTRSFLEHDADRPGDADAVIYMMRHLHQADVAFLDAFMDRSVAASSPVNAVAVLARADEIGAGRLDAMESAGRIARRYEENGQLRQLCASVVPMAGLLAVTGLTLREDEAASLRVLLATPADELEQMLLSADHFCDLHASQLTVEVRRGLLDRLGMFGVRLAVQEIRAGASTAATLGPRLVEASGLPHLRRVIEEHFLPRARILQARSCLTSIRALARDLEAGRPDLAARIDREAEHLEANAVDFARMRAAHLVATAAATVRDDERKALERLLLGASPGAALGIGPGTDAAAVRAAALAAIDRWRMRAADPLADPVSVEVYETAARTSEVIYVAS